MILTGWEVAAAFAACGLIGAIAESMLRGVDVHVSHESHESQGYGDAMVERAMREADRLEEAQDVCLEQTAHGDPCFMWRELYDEIRRCDQCGSILTNTTAPAYVHATPDDMSWHEYAVVHRSCGDCGHYGEYRYSSYAGPVVSACVAQDRLEQAREAWLASEYDVEPDDAIRPGD